SAYLWHHLGHSYPTSFLETAWKWLLRNHHHDSICGCSVDQTHAEMKVRFSWAESIAESIIVGAVETIKETSSPSDKSCVLAFTSGTSLETPVRVEFSQPRERSVKGLQAADGTIYSVQPIRSQEDVFLETTVGMTTAKMGIGMLPGRKLINFYINDFEHYDGDEPGLLELRLIADRQPVGDFDMEDFKKQARELIKSKRYKKIHLVAVRPSQSVYAAVVPLRPWAFTQLSPVDEAPKLEFSDTFEANKNHVSNRFYSITFNKDGTFNAVNTETGRRYERLHAFEDFGDRGDVYTFGRVEPENVKVKNVKRFIMSNGPVMAEIRQTMVLELFETLDDSREKRVGKAEIPIESTFRFYLDTPRIEIITKLTNTAKDHRLRICFDLPFSSEFTQTATHLGCVTRRADAERVPDAAEHERTKSTYAEMPSGIQPQKRFIRIENEESGDAITVFNKGMPEVELVDRKRIAITLVRSVGWLSRSDYPERPIHAGPPEETQGAQEIGTDYEYRYGLLLHSANDPLYMSAEHGEAGSQEVIAIVLDQAEPNASLLEPIIELSNPNIRISSLRVRNSSVMATMFNLKNNDEVTEMKVIGRATNVTEVRIDGTTLREHSVDESKVTLRFSPREIKMCILQKGSFP
ncbi:MAG: glycoside hydrolase family 38 C-terminal domain-containing protein, partial [Candidatus Thorarchaeota archaeon]